jgi:1-deoxy-D-xylulose-5-phosphate reductoisomerase
MKKITVLGSSGSIGTQALDVAERLGYSVVALAARRSAALLESQARRLRPRCVALEDEGAARGLRVGLGDTGVKVLSGPRGVEECAAMRVDCVLNGIVGIAGLRPTAAALEAGNPLALANKESLVAGGALVMALARRGNLPLLPVDSEHSAVFQCLQGQAPAHRLILTASGGAFYGKSREELAQVTAGDALRHPTWAMGAKITVDCATMMNKGFEVIEAAWLFDIPPERVDVVIHRQSVVHSLVEFADGAQLAQLGAPDMRLPIQYALTYPERKAVPGRKLDLAACGALTFEAPDHGLFPAVELCRRAFARGGLACAALNGANEAANALFREGRLGFLEITELAQKAVEAAPAGDALDLKDIFAADKAAREITKRGKR